MNFENLQIEPLACHEKLIPTIAQWYLSAFGRKETTVEKCEERLRSRLNTDCLDCCFVAFFDDAVVGTVSLTTNDIPGEPAFTPCIAHLFVVEECRHKNIGRKLVEYAKQKLKNLNFQKAYLYTTDKTIHEWYERLGWKIIDNGVSNGIEIKILESEL